MLADLALSEFPENWELSTLGEIVDAGGGSVQTGPFGSQLHAADYVDEGIPSVMPKNIAIEGIVEEDIARITPEDASRLSKYLLDDGDIVYSRRGDVEKCALVKAEEAGWLCGTGCLRVRLGQNSKLSPEFLHAYLSTPAIREWISRNAIGATMPNLNTSILRDVPVLVPEAKDIEYVSSCWHVFNSKIQLNRQTNQILESMAQALFKSWFVDFDPVIDNALAAGNTIPETLQKRAEQRRALREAGALDQQAPAPLPEAISLLFPASFVFDTEMGWIPKGWSSKALPEIAEFQNGYAFYKDGYSEQGFKVVDLANISSEGKFVETHRDKFVSPEMYHLEKHKKHHLHENDLVMAMTDMTQAMGILGKCGKIRESGKFILNQRIGRIRVNNATNVNYLMTYLNSPVQLHFLKVRALGTVQKYVNTNHIKEMQFVVPSEDVMEIFGSYVDPYFEKISSNDIQNENLARLRDTLLPKLISGELRIPEAQNTDLDAKVTEFMTDGLQAAESLKKNKAEVV